MIEKSLTIPEWKLKERWKKTKAMKIPNNNTFGVEEHMEQWDGLTTMVLVVNGEQFVVWHQSFLVQVHEFLDGLNIVVMFVVVFKVEWLYNVQIVWFIDWDSGLVWMLQ